MVSSRVPRPSRRHRLPLLGAVVLGLVLGAPTGAQAAGEPGATTTLGTAVNGVAAQADGRVVAVGSAGESMLVQRVAPDGVAEPAFAAGHGTATAVTVQGDGRIVVVGTDGGPVMRRFMPDGTADASFGTGGTVSLGALTPRAVVIGSRGTITVGGSVSTRDSFPQAAAERFTPDGSPDKTFAGDGITHFSVGRNSQLNGLAVQPDGRIVFAGQRAPSGVQVIAGVVGRITFGGNLDKSFGGDGTVAYDAQGGVKAALNGIAVEPSGRIVAGGSDVRASQSLATFVGLTPDGRPDPGFAGGSGVMRVPASVNGTGAEGVGVQALALGGGGEILGAGVAQDSGQRSGRLWALTAAGQLDPAVGGAGTVTTPPAASGTVEPASAVVGPSGTVFVGGRDTSFSGGSTGTVRSFAGFGPPPVNAISQDPALDPPSMTGKIPGALQLLSGTVVRGRLRVATLIAPSAVGRLYVTYRAARRTIRFSQAIPRAPKLIALTRRLPSAMRRSSTGVATVVFRGSDRVHADAGRVTVAPRSSVLRIRQGLIDQSSFLVAGGTVTRRAPGSVLVRLTYLDHGNHAVTLDYPAKIKAGRWRVEQRLPDAAAAAGGVLTVRYAGSSARRLRGAQIVKSVRPVAPSAR